MRAAVITGASSGIGFATAALLARQGWQVFGSIRSAAAAERLSATLGAAVTPLVFDLRDGDAIIRAAERVPAALLVRAFGLRPRKDMTP